MATTFTLFLIALLLNFTVIFPHGFLLKAPPTLCQEKLSQTIQERSMGMRWQGKNFSLLFDHYQGKTFFTLTFIGDLPKTLSDRSRSALTRSTKNNSWHYTYGQLFSIPEFPQSDHTECDKENLMGALYAPLVIAHASPTICTIDQTAAMLHNKHAVFYTGAGISAGAVPTMPELMKNLSIEDLGIENNIAMLTERILENPDAFLQPMKEFYHACLYGKPTVAHYAITEMVQRKNWGLITENLDLLHQHTGVEPLSHGSDWLKKNIRNEDLQAIDYIITVGLASDESGFLAWYKDKNPRGTIIALNLAVPSYLNNKDILILEDAQKALPLLSKILSEN